MRYPRPLEKGQTIGFAAPSYGASIEPYHTLFGEALSNFEKLGYKTLLGPNCYAGEGIGISSTPEKCGEELTDLYTSKDCDILISVGGGECMCETMDFVDFEKVKAADPKWFMGYSDNTHFTFLLNTLCDTASVYGPNASDFGMRPWHKAVSDALEVLSGRKYAESYDKWEINELKSPDDPYAGYNCTEDSCMKAYMGREQLGSLELSGRLTGGCMDVLLGLAGTRFDRTARFTEKYREDGIVWFLESCDLSPMDFRRGLWRLKNCGWFENAKGFIFGRPMHYGEDFAGVTFESAALDMLSGYKVPIIFDADFGHMPPMMPIISGSFANIFYDGKLRIDYEFR
ncbi:MAG: LD-carboxypeptidase [Firmicutes bacterium]|nr:LD-carboxypeptidase [Bacillota bacterium]